jgi:hypothetical protein
MHIHIYICNNTYANIEYIDVYAQNTYTHPYFIYIYYIRKLHSPTQPTWCPPCLTSPSCHWPHGQCGTAECHESRHRDGRPGDGSTDGQLRFQHIKPSSAFWSSPVFIGFNDFNGILRYRKGTLNWIQRDFTGRNGDLSK